MPGLDGYETVRRLKSEVKEQIPTIALTAYVSSDEKERCLAAGMDDYLAKPLQIEEMERMVIRYVHPQLKND